MRRLALAFAAAVLLLAGCGGSAKPHLWLTHDHGKRLTACVSADCGSWTVTLNWTVPPYPNTTGYNLFLNGVQYGTAASSPFLFSGTDCGVQVTLGVQAHNGSGGTGPVWSTPYSSPTCGNAPVNSTIPVVSGTATQGNALSTTNGTWQNAPTSFSYRWQDCNAAGASCANIASATASSYTLQAADVGDTVRSVVTATNAFGAASATSIATAVVAASGGGPTVNFFVAQAAAGTGTGSGSCSNAAAVSTLSTATHWTPGNVIGLCGTITGAGGASAAITAQGSGTAGNPITVYWEPGASVQDPACASTGPNGGPGCFNISGRSFLTLDGGTNGSILSTANGFNEPNANQSSKGIWATNTHDVTIENLNISDMWQLNGSVVGAPGGCGAATSQDASGMQFGPGSNITITNNTFDNEREMGVWNPAGTDTNITITNNVMNGDGTGMNWVSAVNGGGSIGPVVFANNTLSNFSAWETGATACVHDDGIHCWDSPGFTPVHWNGVYIYDNRMSGMGAAFTSDPTSYIFLEGGATGGGTTVCADPTSPWYIFNNVITATGVSNDMVQPASGQAHILNNTIVGGGSSSGSGCTQPGYNGNSGAATVENNLIAACPTLVDSSPAGQSFATVDFNVYSQGGSNSWIFHSSFLSFSTGGFSSWRTSTGGETHSCATFGAGTGSCAGGQTSPLLNADGSPQATSPVLGAGTNLTSLCTGNLSALCTKIDGTARPAVGAWNAGAY